MEHIRVFVADTDEMHIERIAQSIRSHRSLQITGSCASGAEALRRLAECPADVLITELQLPEMDGMMLIRALRDAADPPAALVCTQFYSSKMVGMARAQGAVYCLYKPLDYVLLPELIQDIHRMWTIERRPPVDRRPAGERWRGAEIRSLLSDEGIPCKLSGSIYLTEALMCASENRSLLKNLSKGLYAEVSDRLRVSPACLERSLRNAIGTACDRGDLACRLGHRPSNREFICYMLDRLTDREMER